MGGGGSSLTQQANNPAGPDADPWCRPRPDSGGQSHCGTPSAAAFSPMPEGSAKLEKLRRKLESARVHASSCADPARRTKIEAAVHGLEAKLRQAEGQGQAGDASAAAEVAPAAAKRAAQGGGGPKPKCQRAGGGSAAAGAPAAPARLAAGAALGDGVGLALGERIARAALLAFDDLPARGKPQPHEWTVLAAFLAVQQQASKSPESSSLEVLAIGTGTKCAGQSKLSRHWLGDQLVDSHAEILARRALRRLLLAEYATLIDTPRDRAGGTASTRNGQPVKTTLLERRGNTIGYKPGVRLALYINQPPCGDASIFSAEDRALSEPAAAAGRACACDSDGSERFVIQTGAKPAADLAAANTTAAASGQGQQQQELGVLRTKSGRSDLRLQDRSLSMSCSDKIAKWNAVGVGGALVSLLLPDPLYIDDLVVGLQLPMAAVIEGVGSAEGRALEALERAVVKRANAVNFARQRDPADAMDPAGAGAEGGTAAEVDGERYSTPADRESLHLHLSTACGFAAARPLAQPPGTAPDQSSARQSACGFSLVWHKTATVPTGAGDAVDWVCRAPGLCEVTQGASGLRQGAKMSRDGSSTGNPESSVSKKAMLSQVTATLQAAAAQTDQPDEQIVTSGNDDGRSSGWSEGKYAELKATAA